MNTGRKSTVTSVSQIFVYIIITSVPTSVTLPEIRLTMVLSSIVPILSTSFVKRLIISPVFSLSWNLSGSD